MTTLSSTFFLCDMFVVGSRGADWTRREAKRIISFQKELSH